MLPVLNSCLEQKQVLAGRCHGLTQDPVTHTLYTLQAVFRIRMDTSIRLPDSDPHPQCRSIGIPESQVSLREEINFVVYDLVASLEGAKGFF
jgi:hypothetical protein